MPPWRNRQIHPVTNAPVVELEDTHGLEPCSRKGLEVQILSGAFVTGQAQRLGRCERKFVRVQISPSALPIKMKRDTIERMAKKKHSTIEDLAVMIKRGFDQTATKDELKPLVTKEELRELRRDMTEEFERINADLRDIKVSLGPLVRIVAAMESELKSHRLRIERLERKVGLAK